MSTQPLFITKTYCFDSGAIDQFAGTTADHAMFRAKAGAIKQKLSVFFYVTWVVTRDFKFHEFGFVDLNI